MLIIPYLYQSHNYIPIMSPCFRHIPMSSPFYAHQMALNPIDSPEFPKRAPSPVPQRAKRAHPALQSLARCARWTAGGRAPWSWPQRDHQNAKFRIFKWELNRIEPYWTVLNQNEPESIWYTIFELHPVPTTRARDALDIEKTHQYLAEDRADIW